MNNLRENGPKPDLSDLENDLCNNSIKTHLLTVDQYHPPRSCMQKIKKGYQTVFENIAKTKQNGQIWHFSDLAKWPLEWKRRKVIRPFLTNQPFKCKVDDGRRTTDESALGKFHCLPAGGAKNWDTENFNSFFVGTSWDTLSYIIIQIRVHRSMKSPKIHQ